MNNFIKLLNILLKYQLKKRLIIFLKILNFVWILMMDLNYQLLKIKQTP